MTNRTRACYNPVDKEMHNKLGFECDGELHHNPPLVKADRKPWYNNGDLVAGMVATIVMLSMALLFAGLIFKLFTSMF